MHANLVRAPGADLHFEQSILFEALEHLIGSDRPGGRGPGVPSCACGATGSRAMGVVMRPWSLLHAALRPAPHKSFPLPRRELPARSRCAASLRATRITPLVKRSNRCTMPGRRSPPTAESFPKRCSKALTSVPGVPPGACVDHHARGFVDRDDVGVFIQHLDRNIFGRGLERREFAGIDLDALGALQSIRALLRRAIHQYAPLFDPILQSRTAVLRQAFAQELVQALARRRPRFEVITNHSRYIQ